MRSSLPALVLLAGCPPYIGPDKHRTNLGEGEGTVDVRSLGDLALIPAPPGFTPTDAVWARNILYFSAVGSGQSFLGWIDGDSAFGDQLPGRIEHLAVDPQGVAWALDSDAARVAPVQRLLEGAGWFQLQGASRIGPAPQAGVWVTNPFGGAIYAVREDGSVSQVVTEPGAAWGPVTASGNHVWVLDLDPTIQLVQFDLFGNAGARANIDCGVGDVLRGESVDGNGWVGACGAWWWLDADGGSGTVKPNVGTLSNRGVWSLEELWFTTSDDDGRPVIGFSDNAWEEADVALHDVTLGSSLSSAWVADVDSDGTVWAVVAEFSGGGGIVRLSR